MVVIGLFMPWLIRAYRSSVLDGAAMTYLFVLPTILGAFELESYVSAQPGQSVRRRLKKGIGHPIFFFAAILALIFLWAICLGKIIYPMFA
jgi:hypothetical protein